MATPHFTPDQFTPTEWDSAEDKAKFANHFIRFIESGAKRTLFYKWFYKQLSMTFGHIAHYNIDGFYDVWFSGQFALSNFIDHTLQHRIYGDPAWTYSDVERAIQDKLVEHV